MPGLLLLTGLVALSFAIGNAVPVLSPLALAVLFGFIVANVGTWPEWGVDGSTFAAKHLMRSGVALLGMQMSFATVATLGWRGAIGVVCLVTVTILGIVWMSRRAGLSDDLGLLIGVGYGVCGASAIAAVRPHTKATQEETSYAIALVTLCGSLSILVLPMLGAALGLDATTFGAWAGAAVHDVGQVVATASLRGDVALQAAVVIKLMRVLMLAPVVLVTSIAHRRRAGASGVATPIVPGFVVVFIGLLVVNSTGLVPEALASAVTLASKVLLAYGLAALGSGVRAASLRSIGGRPLLVGLAAWAFVAAVAYVLILLIF